MDTFVDFIRRKVLEDFKHVFADFGPLNLFKAEVLEGQANKSELECLNICSPSKSLSLWIIQITKNVLVR